MTKRSLLLGTSLGLVALTLFVGDAQAQSRTSSLSCPPNYVLSIDPPPAPTDDPANPVVAKPLSAADKLQAAADAKANELSRWHCVPKTEAHAQPPQPTTGEIYDQQ